MKSWESSPSMGSSSNQIETFEALFSWLWMAHWKTQIISSISWYWAFLFACERYFHHYDLDLLWSSSLFRLIWQDHSLRSSDCREEYQSRMKIELKMMWHQNFLRFLVIWNISRRTEKLKRTKTWKKDQEKFFEFWLNLAILIMKIPCNL